MKTCPRCYHPMDEHDFRRCNHLAGTPERCRCWVANPARAVPRWYGPLVGVLLCVIAALALSSCGAPPLNRDQVRCEGDVVQCDCVMSCRARKVWEVEVTWMEGEGCEPVCRRVIYADAELR